MFDPYHKWLGIPPDQRPPTYYQLLGIAPGEPDIDVIDGAAVRQMQYVRHFQSGEHAELCARLLTELSQARNTLTDPEKRQAYDANLALVGTRDSARVGPDNARSMPGDRSYAGGDYELAETAAEATNSSCPIGSVSPRAQKGTRRAALAAISALASAMIILAFLLVPWIRSSPGTWTSQDRRLLRPIDQGKPTVHDGAPGGLTASNPAPESATIVALDPPVNENTEKIIVGGGFVTVIAPNGGSTKHLSAMEAVRAAAAGSRIMFRSGQYRIARLVVDKRLLFIGDGKRDEIQLIGTLRVATEDITIRGLSIIGQAARGMNTDDPETAAVAVKHGSLLLADCVITGHLTGVCVTGPDSKVDILQCVIRDTDSKQDGVRFTDGACGVLSDCQIVRNGGIGLRIANGADPRVLGCEISQNRLDGVGAGGGGRGTFRNCSIIGNAAIGVKTEQDSNTVLIDCDLAKNRSAGVLVNANSVVQIHGGAISANDGHGILVAQQSRAEVRRCRILDGKSRGLEFRQQSKGILEYCDVSSQKDVGLAIESNSQVSSTRCKFGKSQSFGIVLVGSAATFVDCDIFENASHGLRIWSGARPEMVGSRIYRNRSEGITIIDGGGEFSQCDVFENGSFGVGLAQNANPTFRDCRMRNGQSFGVDVGPGCSGVFDGCQISANKQSGVRVRTGAAESRFVNCTIQRNGEFGCVVHNNARGLFDTCRLLDNAKSGIALDRPARDAQKRRQIAQVTVTNCEIGNNKEFGVYNPLGSRLQLSNTTFRDNGKGPMWDSANKVSAVQPEKK